MKVFWTGTDSLMLIDLSKRSWKNRPYWILFRLYARFLDFFCQEHYAVSPLVASNIRRFGFKKPIKIVPDVILHPNKLLKVQHDDFRILYYHPSGGDQKFIRWLYGVDYVEYLNHLMFLSWFKIKVTFVKCDGKQNMEDIYPYIDFMVRPNRHDGHSRMIDECEINGIPYYWSVQNPDLVEMTNLVKNEIRKKYESIGDYNKLQ